MKYALLTVWLAIHGGEYHYCNPLQQTYTKMTLRLDAQMMQPKYDILVTRTYLGPLDDPEGDAIPWLRDFPGYRHQNTWISP